MDTISTTPTIQAALKYAIRIFVEQLLKIDNIYRNLYLVIYEDHS